MDSWNNRYNDPMSNDDYGSLPRTTQMSDPNYNLEDLRCKRCGTLPNKTCPACNYTSCQCDVNSHVKNVHQKK